MRSMRQLLIDAIAVIQEEREVIHTSNVEADGVVRDDDAIETINLYDRWLDEARAVTRTE